MVEMGNLFKAETELIDKIRELMIEMQPKLSPGLKAEVWRTWRPRTVLAPNRPWDGRGREMIFKIIFWREESQIPSVLNPLKVNLQ